MTLFDPANFRSPSQKTITIGNSAHPVAEHVVGLYLKRIPSKCDKYRDLYYIELVEGKGVVTYHDDDNYPTIQYHKKTLEEFKSAVVAKESLNPPYEVENIDPKNKWVGNDILRLLKNEEIVE